MVLIIGAKIMREKIRVIGTLVLRKYHVNTNLPPSHNINGSKKILTKVKLNLLKCENFVAIE